MLRRLLVIALLHPLSACGSETKTSKSDGATRVPVGMTFADEGSLPKCDASKQGHLVYVTQTKTFKTCTDGEWATIDISGPPGEKGEKGEKGDKGDKGDAATTASGMNAAVDLYRNYRRSVFRVRLECGSPRPNAPPGCSQIGNVFLGNAFLCGPQRVCTNRHVVDCANHQCFQSLTKLSIQALNGDADTLNPNGTPVAPFFETSSATLLKFHPGNRDLAVIQASNIPSGLTPIPLAEKPASETIAPLKSMLSLSFPLGFHDLYVDVGYVNTPQIGECGQGRYSCPKDYYDFSTSNDTDHGSSGSPLIDVETGQAVGVTSAGTEGENANYTWAIDASLLRAID